MLRLFVNRRLILNASIALLSFVLLLPIGVRAAPHSYSIPVLMYHYISAPPPGSDASRSILSVTPEHFQAQMKWLNDNGYTTIKPDDLVSGQQLPPKAVLITIDDGYIDAYTNAFPILKALGQTVTFFIVTDWVDQNKPGYVNWSQVREMAQGGMSIQAHSRTHDNMKGRSADWLKNEIVGSMDAIEDHVGVRPRFFAYPNGSYDTNTVKAAKAAGLAGAFTTVNGFYDPTENKLLLPRLRIRGTSTVQEVAGLVLRAG